MSETKPRQAEKDFQPGQEVLSEPVGFRMRFKRYHDDRGYALCSWGTAKDQEDWFDVKLLHVSVEELWKEKVKKATEKKPLWDLHGRASTEIGADTFSVEDLVSALTYLSSITGDVAFDGAKRALAAYGLESGGLKSATKKLVKASNLDLYTAVLPEIAKLVEPTPGKRGLSARKAAEKVAIKYGLPGHSLAAVVDELRKAYSASQTAIPAEFPAADTGRKLRVRLGAELLQNGISSLFDQSFDAKGFAKVPDDRRWRRLIDEGEVIFLGAVHRADEPEILIG